MSSLPRSAPAPASAGRRRRADAGFTLIELLVVLVILGLLAAVAGPRVVGYLGGARSDTARIQLAALEQALDLYRLDVGRYPSTEEGLTVLVRQPSGTNGWNGPYIDGQAVPADPWGHPYVYRMPGSDGPYDLYTLGADNRPGGTGENAPIGRGAR
jgi:general secretion pathway protein G